ncbi:TetR/AcrR family transcriptional regulator [Ruminococcus sp.]|uniref:TetR/AcrR family transcriptional regulator n=1 Tax=Ruminococcus sp. TaxID=41978 RepID=UPI0025CC2B1F|nr:TetR/AcrR family transcriptional regulator [Ruminococcus sp.]MBQ8967449.1 TetR/AcrR family transcriptional regulator [Ruminococcus sp.]
MTRKEQKEMRQKQIIFKALELFVTKGFSETKISDIAEALGISVGLLFHYYESKEALYKALVTMGVEATKRPESIEYNDPTEYFTRFAQGLFKAAEEQPWVFQMFVLMSQARRQGIPEDIRQLALSVDQVKFSAEIIKKGQQAGSIKEGDPTALSFAYWCSIQGVMEQHIISPEMPLPEAEWITDILKK